jgi:hypothetical protein
MVTLQELKEMLISRYYVREDSIEDIALARLLVEAHEAGRADNDEDMCSFLGTINPHVYGFRHQFTEDTPEDLRYCLENLPCAMDTSAIPDDVLNTIKMRKLDELFKDYDILDDWADAAICDWWRELEYWASGSGGKYYEDLVFEDIPDQGVE